MSFVGSKHVNLSKLTRKIPTSKEAIAVLQVYIILNPVFWEWLNLISTFLEN